MIKPGLPADSSDVPDAIPDELQWRVHLFKENPRQSVLLVAIIFIVLVGVWFWIPEYPVGAVLLTAALLIGSVAPYLFPIHYHLTGVGIEILFLGVRTFRGWKEFKNYYPHNVGVHLSTFRRPSRLDPFRGSFIRFAGNRDAVLRFLNAHIERESKPDKAGPEG